MQSRWQRTKGAALAPDIPVFDAMKHQAELTRDVEAVLNDLCQRVKPLKRYRSEIRTALFRVTGASAQLGYQEASREAVTDRALFLGTAEFTVID